MSEELKPCPFCGSPAKMWSWNGGTRVDCSAWRDGHFVGVEGRTEDEAVKAWNTRYGDAEDCDTCKWHYLEWCEEPCDSCTMDGENNHYERAVYRYECK